jgi:hypothetical protein
MFIRPGIEVPSGGLGFTIFSFDFKEIRSSKDKGYSVIGH